VLKLEVYLHAFQTSAQDRSDVISCNKYLRNIKPFITGIVRQWLMDWHWVRQWSVFISGFTSHTISCLPATLLAQTLIQFFITTLKAEDIRSYLFTPHRYLLAKEVLCKKKSLAMISTAGDALILITTVLSTGLVKLKAEFITENIFPH